ncbi:MAG: hypothetical protein U0638_08285 [Phycisphaerales bacterium]
MVKVLRKYNKYILVVGGVLLMVAFLMPTAINEFRTDPMKRVAAHIGDQGIRQRDLFDAEMNYRAIKHVMPAFLAGAIGTPIVDGSHWYLLVREARAGGFIGGEQDGKDWELPKILLAQEIARQQFKEYADFMWQQGQTRDNLLKMAEQYMPGVINRASNETRLRPDQVYTALAEARGIERMRTAFEGAARFSDKRTLIDAAKRFDRAEFDALVIEASAFTHAIPEPTPEQLAAQFEKYKNTKPGEGDTGVGYLLPARVKLEYLTLDRAKIAEAIQVDPVDVRKRQTVDRTKDPAGFNAERETVTAQLRNEKVDRIITDADEAIKAEVQRVLRKLPTENGYHVLPADWATTRPSWEAIAQAAVEQVKQRSGVTMPLPTVTVRASDWLTVRDLRQLSGIGMASVRIGARNVAFAQKAVEVKELTGATDAQMAEVPLQVGVPFVEMPVSDQPGNHYYFTILDSRAESSAASVDEVTKQAIEDFKRLAAFDKLTSEAANFAALAAKDGLSALAKLVNEQMPKKEGESTPMGAVEPLKNLTLNRVMTIQAPHRALDDQAFRDAMMAVASKLDPLKAATEMAPEERIVHVSNPKLSTLVIAQLAAHRPLTQEDWIAMQAAAARALASDEIREAFGASPVNPFEYEQMKVRANFKLEREPNADKANPGAPKAPAKS